MEFGLISGSNLFTSRVLNFFRKMELKPMFIIQTSRERSFFKRFIFRLKKYGFISTIAWIINSLSLRSKTNINYSKEYNTVNIDSTDQIETVLKKFNLCHLLLLHKYFLHQANPHHKTLRHCTRMLNNP